MRASLLHCGEARHRVQKRASRLLEKTGKIAERFKWRHAADACHAGVRLTADREGGMQLVRINPALSAGDQIDEHDVQALAGAGIKAIICNRPDSEGGTPSQRIAAACARNGVRFFMQPVEYSALGVADGDTFGQILQQCEQPALAYCRSARRSVALWAIASAPLVGEQAVIGRAGRIGVALDDLRPVLARSAARADPPYAPSTDPAARERFIRRWVADGD
jgi:uncharacterized protein (TIGR01244 family)